MRDQCPPGDLVQDLGPARLHAGALASSQDHGKTGSRHRSFSGRPKGAGVDWVSRFALKSGEGFEKPEGHGLHAPGQKQDAGEDEETAHHLFDGTEMGPETLQRAQERAREDRREKERDAEPQRIDGQQPAPLPTVCVEPATPRIAPRTGPMQGVQPKAKARPIA